MPYTIKLPLGEIEDADHIHSAIVGKRRWFYEYEVVFKREKDGCLYRAKYDRPATETVESPYEDGDFIECTKVHAVEKTVTVYETTK